MSDTNIQNVIGQMRALAQRSGLEVPVTAPSTDTARVDFSRALGQALDQVNRLQVEAGDLQDRFIRGDSEISLAQVMAAGQKSKIAFHATLEVRNRFIAAYEEIMRMQI